jgi:hypothetical protein
MDDNENLVLLNMEKAAKSLTSAHILFDHDDRLTAITMPVSL